MSRHQPQRQSGAPLRRREFLYRSAAAAGLPLALLAREGWAQERGRSGLIVRQSQPPNLEMPFHTLDSFITPTDQFYVRSHFPVPKLDAATWQLRVEGHVDRPFSIGYEDLLALRERTMVSLLECAGNGRVYLSPAAAGVQWAQGAVGNAEWTGVPLATLLERAGVKRGAVEVVLEGADGAELRTDPRPTGPVKFARSLPLAKAQQPDVLLASRMNGRPLTVPHGYPVRAVVPGWYGMASIKWLTRIVVLDEPFQGHFQTVDYAYYQRRNGLPVRVPLGEMQVKSQIARPALHESVEGGGTYRITGAAWTGDSEVSKVEVSTDGGKTWSEARLQDRGAPRAWRLWEYQWKVPRQPGAVTLMSRATDARGRTQPMEHDRDRANYMITHVVPVEVSIR